MRQTAIISELSEDYVRKLIYEQRSNKAEPSLEGMTSGMLRRKKVIDEIMSLRGGMFVERDQKYCYISLLAYMGFTIDEIKELYPLDNASFISVSVYRSGGAWKNFDSSILGINPDDYRYTFVEHDLTWKPQSEAAAKEQQQEVTDRTAERRRAKMTHSIRWKEPKIEK